MRFLLDTGANHHLTGDREILASKLTLLRNPLRLGLAGTKHTVLAHHIGSINFALDDGANIHIKDVHYVPDSRINILSVDLLMSAGWSIDLNNLRASYNGREWPIERKNGLFYVSLFNKTARTPLTAAAINHDSPMAIEHRRLGHIGTHKLKVLADAGLLRYDGPTIASDSFKLEDCPPCQRFKGTRLSKGNTSPSGSKDGEMVHVDIAGPFDTSKAGNRYYVAITADYTCVNLVVPIASKDQAWGALESFVPRLERQSGIPVKVVRTDQGTEFRSAHALGFYKRLGIIHQQTPRYTPELNGKIERFNRTIKEMSMTMLEATPLGHAYWDYAVRYASIILNKTTMSEDNRVAWSIITGRDAGIDKIREFGELCFVHLSEEVRKKSNFTTARSLDARILGQAQDMSGWIVRLEQSGETLVSRDVTSASGAPLDTPLARITPPGQPRPIQPTTAQRPEASREVPVPLPTSSTPVSTSTPSDIVQTQREPVQSFPALPAPPPTTLVKSKNTPTPRSQPSRAAKGSANLIADGETFDHHLIAESSDGVVTRLDSLAAFVAAITPDEDEPKTAWEALNSPDASHWLEAMHAEVSNLENKNTWVECTLPPGKKTIGSIWVFKKKRDNLGQVAKYKARLVAQGFTQQPGVDFENTWAPVGRMTSLRIILTLAAKYGLKTRQVDIEGAYLNAENEFELYMRFPSALHPSDPRHNALRILKSIYGLKQSAHDWWRKVTQKMQDMGFKRVESDWGMYIKYADSGKVEVIALVYVDDFLFAYANDSTMDTILESMREDWTVTDLGEASRLLGMQVRRDLNAKKAFLSQTAYIDELMAKFPGHKDFKVRSAPLPNVRAAADDVLVAVSPYMELIGRLQWIAGCTRPDIAFAASYLARSCSAPTEQHWNEALRVVSYLANTRTARANAWRLRRRDANIRRCRLGWLSRH